MARRWFKQWAPIDWMTSKSLDWRSSALVGHEIHLGSFEKCWIFGYTPDQFSRISGFWGSPVIPRCSHDETIDASELLGCFLQTYMNLELSGWEVIQWICTEKLALFAASSVSSCEPNDCFEDLGENSSGSPKQSLLLDRSNPPSY